MAELNVYNVMQTRADELFMLYIDDSYNLRTREQGKLYSVLRLLLVGLYFHRRMSFFSSVCCAQKPTSMRET